MKKLFFLVLIGLTLIVGTGYGQQNDEEPSAELHLNLLRSQECVDLSWAIYAAAVSRDDKVSMDTHIARYLVRYLQELKDGSKPEDALNQLRVQMVAAHTAYSLVYKESNPMTLEVNMEVECQKVGYDALFAQLHRETFGK